MFSFYIFPWYLCLGEISLSFLCSSFYMCVHTIFIYLSSKSGFAIWCICVWLIRCPWYTYYKLQSEHSVNVCIRLLRLVQFDKVVIFLCVSCAIQTRCKQCNRSPSEIAKLTNLKPAILLIWWPAENPIGNSLITSSASKNQCGKLAATKRKSHLFVS